MKLKDLIMSIEDDIRVGSLSFRQIAEKYQVEFDMVNQVWEQMCEQESSED